MTAILRVARSPRCVNTSPRLLDAASKENKAELGAMVAKSIGAPPEGYAAIPTSVDINYEAGAVGADDGTEDPAWILEDIRFQCTMALLIIGNAILIGCETDMPEYDGWAFFENTFLVVFIMELLLKFFLLGISTYFEWQSNEFYWNIFDFAIIGLGIFDTVMSTLKGKSSGGCATLFRLIRMLRIMRIFKVLKFLKQLYLLAYGLIEACKAVFWVTIIMFFVLYICSIVLVKVVGRPDRIDPHHDFLSIHFGCICDSMLTLFVLMSSPNLSVYLDEAGLLEERPYLIIFLVSFITFGSFGMVALLTGVISESMFEKNEMRKVEARKEHEAARQSLSGKAADLFESIGVGENGRASLDQCRELAPYIVEMLDAAGAEFTRKDAEALIKHMDTDHSGTIHCDEFVHTIEKIADGLSPSGLQEVHALVGACDQRLQDADVQINIITKNLAVVSDNLQRLLLSQEHGLIQVPNGAGVVPASANSPGLVRTPPPAPQQQLLNSEGGDIQKVTQSVLTGVSNLLAQSVSSMQLEIVRQCTEFSAFQAQEVVRQCKEFAFSQEQAILQSVMACVGTSTVTKLCVPAAPDTAKQPMLSGSSPPSIPLGPTTSEILSSHQGIGKPVIGGVGDVAASAASACMSRAGGGTLSMLPPHQPPTTMLASIEDAAKVQLDLVNLLADFLLSGQTPGNYCEAPGPKTLQQQEQQQQRQLQHQQQQHQERHHQQQHSTMTRGQMLHRASP